MARPSLAVKTKRLQELEKDLRVFSKKSIPYATRHTINRTAFKARESMQGEIRNKMISRNTFTERAVRVEQTRSLIIDQQEATTGSVAPYMDKQEFGGVSRKPGKYGTVIPTSWAAGQEGANPRTKLPRGQKNIRNIQITKRKAAKFRGKKQKARALAFQAANKGDKYVFLDGANYGQSGPAIFRIWGRSRVRGRFQNFKLRMAYSFDRNPTPISKLATLDPAVTEAEKHMPEFYREALQEQIRRNGIQLDLKF